MLNLKQILDRVNMEGLVKSFDIIYKYNSEELMKPCDFSTAEFDMSVDEKSINHLSIYFIIIEIFISLPKP
jgi:hypothetical protein